MLKELTPLLFISLLALPAADSGAAAAAAPRNLVTDEPRTPKGKPAGAPDYVPKSAPTDGQHLALTMRKLEDGLDPARPFLIWAIGSSYTNMLGNGEAWTTEIPKRFPKAPPIEYRKMVGNSCPWQYLRGWARHLVIPDQPDLVLIYTIGDPADLEKLIVELRTHTTADIIVPSIHWREGDVAEWGKSENSPQQDVAAVREICRKHAAEFVENRRDWGEYLRANNLPISSLLKDAVHQSDYGAHIINANILAHLRRPEKFSYSPAARERRIKPAPPAEGVWKVAFTGNRIDLIGRKSPGGGAFKILVDGKPAEQTDAFLLSYVQPGEKHSKQRIGTSPTVPRDSSPHGITLGRNVAPQTWTIVMTSDTGEYELSGSVTGRDGRGNAFKPFTSASGQIVIEPELWRRAERNRTGDRFTFTVRRAVVPEVDFRGAAGKQFVVRLAQVLPNQPHTLELVPARAGEAAIEAWEVVRPPLAAPEAPVEPETDPQVLAKLERFQDWKFGFFMHWGIYSQWGCIESWPLVEVHDWGRPDDLAAWTSRGKDFARFSRDYRALNQTFNPQKFDPAKWAAAARDAGMKYAVFTTKHHDGFCLFDTRQTDYRTTHPSCPFHTNPQADIAKAVFEAFRVQGFRIGAYYSKSDWHHPDYWAPEWPHKDRNVNYDTAKYPERWARFVGFTHRIVEELMTGYGPIDLLWLDGGQVRPPKQDIDMPRLAAMARKNQPGLIMVDRGARTRYENYRTPEQKVPAQPPPYVWETCMTMGEQWSYKPNDKYKSTRELVHLLVDIVAKGGNFLLNVGPDADGKLPAPALERMEQIGRWMKVNGEAIYGTRAVPPYKQGRVCLTKKGDALYAILLAEENETRPPASFTIPAVRGASAVRMLGCADAPTAVPSGVGLVISVPAAARAQPPCEHAWAFEITGAQIEP